MTTASALLERITTRFRQLPAVTAIAIAGSQATGTAGEHSDIDLYIYTLEEILPPERLAIGREFSSDVQIIDFWGPGMEWNDPETGIHIDMIFFPAAWMEDQVAPVLDRHEAWLGYTTCFWHTVRVSQLLFDREGWFARLQQKAAQPYPDALVKAIVDLNFPVLRDIYPSYLTQIEKAARRGDIVSLNHRTAALLASYFDILFAINRVPHPGEKRLLDFVERLCVVRPPEMRQQVTTVLHATPSDVTICANALIEALELVLRAEGWL